MELYRIKIDDVVDYRLYGEIPECLKSMVGMYSSANLERLNSFLFSLKQMYSNG